jgi:hypothetical protein
MHKKQNKQQLPTELKNELLKIALATDIAGAHNIKGWRMDLICAARWLLRAAVLAPGPISSSQKHLFKQLVRISEVLNNFDDQINEFEKLSK